MWTTYKNWVIVSKGATIGINNIIYLENIDSILLMPVNVFKMSDVNYYYNSKINAVVEGVEMPLCDTCESKYKHYFGDCNINRHCNFILEKDLPPPEIDIKGYYIDSHLLLSLKKRSSFCDLVEYPIFSLEKITEKLTLKNVGRGFKKTLELEELSERIKVCRYSNDGLPYIDGIYQNGKIDKDAGTVPNKQNIRLMLAYLYTKYQIKDNKIYIPSLGEIEEIRESNNWYRGRNHYSVRIAYKVDNIMYHEHFNLESIQERI